MQTQTLAERASITLHPNCFSQESCLLSMTHSAFNFSTQWNKFSRWSRASPAVGYTPFGRWAMVVLILSHKEKNKPHIPLLGDCCRVFKTFSIQLHFEEKQQLPLGFRWIQGWELSMTWPAHKAGRRVSAGEGRGWAAHSHPTGPRNGVAEWRSRQKPPFLRGEVLMNTVLEG